MEVAATSRRPPSLEGGVDREIWGEHLHAQFGGWGKMAALCLGVVEEREDVGSWVWSKLVLKQCGSQGV